MAMCLPDMRMWRDCPSFCNWYAVVCLAVLGCWLYGSRRAGQILHPLKEQLGKPNERIHKEEIRVLCQNCWNVQWPGTTIKGNTGRYANERFDALVAAASEGNYDVVALQELFVLRVGPFVFGAEVVHLKRRLVDAGYVYHTDIAYNLPPYFGQSAGVAIFSRVPIVSRAFRSDYFSFSATSLKEWTNRKGFVHVQLAVSPPPSPQSAVGHRNEFVHIITAHLDSSSDSNVRLAQVDEIAHAVRRLPPHETVLVCGDFNISPGQSDSTAEYRSLVKSLQPLAEVFPEVKQTYRDGGAFDHMFVGQLDGDQQSTDTKKIVVNKEVVDFRTSRPGLPVSDHFGLAATVRFK